MTTRTQLAARHTAQHMGRAHQPAVGTAGPALMACALCAMATMGATAQTPKPSVAPPDERIRFLSLEELERREQLIDIRDRLLAEKGAWETVLRDAEDTFRSFKDIAKVTSDDDKVLAYVRLHRRILECIDTLGDNRKRLLDINSAIDAAAKNTEENPSVATYISQARTQTGKTLNETGTLHARLRALDEAVKRSVHSVPPPPRFTTSTGQAMILVKNGQPPFYVSEKPVSVGQFGKSTDPPRKETPGNEGAEAPEPPATGLSWYGARRFCQWLSETEKRVYRLPDITDFRALNATEKVPPLAVWSGTPWRYKDIKDRTMAERFGITMFGMWDPTGKLGAVHLFPELPFATYPEVGILVVTSEETGRAARWDRLKTQLDE